LHEPEVKKEHWDREIPRQWDCRKAPTRIGNGGRNTVKISSTQQFIFKTLVYLFIPNYLITTVVLYT